MKENSILKIAVPVVAVLVIFESVMVVSNLSNRNQTKTNVIPVVTQTPNKSEVSTTPIDLVFGTDNKEMKIGKTYAIELNLLSKVGYSLDAIDLYVKYDQSAFKVENLTFGSRLPKPTFSKISDQKSLIVSNFLISDQGGLKIAANEIVPILKFNVTPKKAGDFVFEINQVQDQKESATLFIENSTSKVLPFLSNKLNVKAIK